MAKTSASQDLDDAKVVLQRNATLLNPKVHAIVWNTNAALLHMCDALQKIQRDVEFLHNKLQPILKELSDDQDDAHRLTRGGRT